MGMTVRQPAEPQLSNCGGQVASGGEPSVIPSQVWPYVLDLRALEDYTVLLYRHSSYGDDRPQSKSSNFQLS